MHSTILPTLALLATSTSALVLPRQTSQNQSSIATLAGGDAPDGPPPANISDTAVKVFQTVNFLENLESAFFAEGLKNLTSMWNKDSKLDTAMEIVTKVQAQEEIHIKTATNILNHFKKPTFEPCKYSFPVSSAEEFFSLANIITSVGLGGVINVASVLATTDPMLVQGPASILAIEARHDAFFRSASKVSEIPNPAPFDTRISAPYALNLASEFIVPGSCMTGMPDFPKLTPMMVYGNSSAKVTGSSGLITFMMGKGKMNSSESMMMSGGKGMMPSGTGMMMPSQTSMMPASSSMMPTSSSMMPIPSASSNMIPMPSSSSMPTAMDTTHTSGTYYIGWVNQANVVKYTPAMVHDNKVKTTIPDGLAGIAFAALTMQNEAMDVEALTEKTMAGPAVVQIS